MKKFIISTLALMVAMTMSAITYVDQVSITLDDGAMYSHTMVVGESNDLNDGLNSGYYAEIQNLGEMPVAIYALYGGVKYSTLAMNQFANLPIGIKTTNVTTYTLYFDDVTGAVNLYDKKLNAPVTVSEGGDYEFTIEESEKNSLINDRFYLNYDAAAFTYSLTTNEYGWASYSNEVEDVVATVPTGLKIYKGAISGDVLNLNEVDYVPVNQGVIVYGMPNTTYYFGAGSGSSSFADNDLKPSSAWASHAGTIYCLKGNALFEYTGSDMPANKAYLQVGGSSAPKRISLQVNAEQGVENVNASVKAEKFVENGQILIKRGENVFNLQGQIVK